MIERLSPNRDARAPGTPVDILLLHYTGMRSADEALARLCDPAARVSAHYVIDEDGTVLRLVDEAARAWHAGESAWAGATDINARSIGIELVNPGHEFGYRRFPEAQMAALEVLAADIIARNPIPPHRVLGHSDVAPSRKTDPGELFDWPRLARAGVGLWPVGLDAPPEAAEPDIEEARRLLAAFGYRLPASTGDDPGARDVVAAFQRHFRPATVDGQVDGETVVRLRRLVAAVPAGS